MSEPADNARRIEQAARLVTALQQPDVYPHAVDDIRVVETHLSWLVLTGTYAYKIKKPIELAFVDFSSLERRRHACEIEVALNRRLAPELYVDVVAIGGTPEDPELDTEPAIEYAVKMHEFPSDARLDRQVAAGTVEAEQLERFAERIAAFHDAMADTLDAETAAGHDPDAAFAENLDELRDELDSGRRADLEPLETWHAREAAGLGRTFAARLAGGFVRDVHGDLHLENVVLLDGEIVAFDALEFNRALRSIDVIDEAAFLVMDLATRDRPDLAFAFLSRYLQVTGDYAGLAVLRFYLAHRALVRAKVRAIAARQHASSGDRELDYLTAAARFVTPQTPRLIVMHGLSASGKSSVAAALVRALRAVAIRSDLERKRLFAVAELGSSGSGVGTGIYADEATRRTYAALERQAAHALTAGLDAIVDAACLERAARDGFRDLALRHGAGFVLVDCTASREELERRIVARAERNDDPSEATLEVLDRQIRTQDALDAGERAAAVHVDTTAEIDCAALAERIEAAARERGHEH
jgi:hypothetical protein